MARIRSLKPEAFTSPDMRSLDLFSRLTFIGLWTYADDYGVGLADPALIHAALWPGDALHTQEDVVQALAALSERSMVRFFEVDGRLYLHISNWDRHQRVARPSARRLPAPEQAECIPHATLMTYSMFCTASPEFPPQERNREQGTGNREQGTHSDALHEPARRSRKALAPSNGRASIEHTNGTNPVAAFFAEANRAGWKPEDSWRGKVSGAVARASRSGIEPEHIVAALEECARRRTLTHFANILADVQVGAPIGRPPAPFAPRPDEAGAALRRVFADVIPDEESE